MASLTTLQDTFNAGVRRDNARDSVPRGGLWWSQDMLPNIGARLRERGGWTNASDAITGVFAAADFVEGGIFAPFAAASQNLAVAEDNGVSVRLVKVDSNGTVTDLGLLTAAIKQNPVFHRNLVVIPYAAGAPQKYTGAAIAALGGSPPSARHATVFNDRTVLGRGTAANPERIWFSDPGDPEGWNTVDGYWDFSYPVTGLASLKNAILVFHEAYFSRLVGTSPPPGGDLRADDPLFNVGCVDARSIAYWNDRVIFANAEGIYVTDGAGIDDITARCGMTQYWQETMSAYAASTWIIAGGVIRDHYCFTVLDGSTFKASAMIDLRRFAYWPVTNLDSRAMWVGHAAADQLYFGRAGAARVGSLSSVFMPAEAVKSDGNTVAVAGLIETAFFRGKPTTKGWRRLFTTHHLRDYATDNPTITVAYVKTPEATSYTNLSATLAETSAEQRKLLHMGFSSSGVGLRYTRAGAGDWQLNHIEADVSPREGSR